MKIFTCTLCKHKNEVVNELYRNAKRGAPIGCAKCMKDFWPYQDELSKYVKKEQTNQK